MILIQTEDFVVSFALSIKLFFSIGGGTIPVGGNPRVPPPPFLLCSNPCLEWVCQDCFLKIYDEKFYVNIYIPDCSFLYQIPIAVHLRSTYEKAFVCIFV